MYDGSSYQGDSSDEGRRNSQYVFQLDLIMARSDVVCDWHVLLLTQNAEPTMTSKYMA